MTDDTDPLAAGVPAVTPADVRVRAATADELAAVLGVLDAAALETDRDRVAASIERGGTLVAVRIGTGAVTGEDSGGGAATGEDDDGPVLGALVFVGDRIDAVAVRRRLRGQGIGTALVAAAAPRRSRLVADFDAGVRPFYETLGFDVDQIAGEDERYRGEWHRADG